MIGVGYRARRVFIGLGLLLLGGCRLVITTDGSGQIVSASGQYDCSSDECAFEITEKTSDVFTALPAENYRFVRWRGLCSNTPIEVCEATVQPLRDDLRHLDGDIDLWAEFEPTSTRREWFEDADGDNWGTPTRRIVSRQRPDGYVVNDKDCDDTNAEIRPYIWEREDGVDTNCNGKVDEGFVDFPFYRDSDGDGFGNPSVMQMALKAPEGYVENKLDCDDGDRRINPWGDEVLDQRDNDCDGLVDEGANRFYRDVDGDGYGTDADYVDAIDAPGGYVEAAGDCDDNNREISPAQPERFDSVDNNCNGQIDEGFTERQYFADSDGDGYGDPSVSVVDISRPSGYVSNDRDNCVDIYNPTQADSDGDGLGDACDPVDNSPQPPPPPPTDTGSSCAMSAEDQAMLDAVNAFRAQPQQCGAGSYPAAAPLAWRCELQQAALAHSIDMATRNFFDHTGSDGSSPGDRLSRAGYSGSAWGENIAAGYSSVNSVMQGWIGSPGHCANMMNPSFTEFGSARYSDASSEWGTYWTQVFGRSF